MLNSISISHVFVADQDKALDFYVGKLGLEVSNDQDLGFMRWLTVRVPGQPGRDILLEKPGPPSMDDATAPGPRADRERRLRIHVGFTTSDCRKTYETLPPKASSSRRSRSSSRTASTRLARSLRQPHPDRAAQRIVVDGSGSLASARITSCADEPQARRRNASTRAPV